MKEKGTYKIYGYSDIQRYINGQMSSAEMYALEKQSLDDPFLMDAIDGYNEMNSCIAVTDVETLKTKLQPLQEAKVVSLHNANTITRTKFPWTKFGIAASVIGIIAFVGFQYLGKSKENEVAIKEQVKTDTKVENGSEGILSNVDSIIKNNATANGRAVKPEPKKIIFVKPDDIKGFYSKIEPSTITSSSFDFSTNDDKEKFKVPTPVVSSKVDSIDANFRRDKDDVVAVEKEQSKQFGEIVAAKPIEKQNEGVLNNDRRFQNTNMPTNGNYSINKSEEKIDQFGYSVQNGILNKKREQTPALNYMFNYRVTDAQGNHIPFSNISVPADQLVTYSRVDGRFGLFSSDSVLKVNIKAAGFQAQQVTLVNSNTYKNIVLKELPNTDNAVVINGNKDFFSVKKSAKLVSIVEEVEPLDGFDNYDSYIANNIDIKEKPKGEVVLAFDVSSTGEATNIKVSQSLSAQADEEAIRLLTNGPKWKALKKKKSKGKIVIKF